MMLEKSEGRVSVAGLLRNVLWRTLLWYAAAGAILGGLYGCSVLSVLMFAPGIIEDTLTWISRVTTAICGIVGLATGWIAAWRGLWRMPASTGAVIGLLLGIPVGGFVLAFYYVFAFPIGAVMGGAYGLATGVVNSILIVIARRAFETGSRPHRRLVVRASALGGTLTPAFLWTLVWFFDGAPGATTSDSPWIDVAIVVAIPSLVLCIVSRWLGGLVDDRLRGRAKPGP